MSNISDAPKVFLSYASEDKERFVLGFGKMLRERGVDLWLGDWEILPGDSLVDKIFNEGLKNASAVIVVLSTNSVNKPWVVEELNASIVSRISKGLKIIPVVIDSCEVPEPLRSTVWQNVDDLANPASAVDRIVAALYEHRDKPPLGPPPAYASYESTTIAGLNRVDSLMFVTACESLVGDNGLIVETLDLLGPASELAIPESEIRDGLDVLENNGLIEVHHTLGPSIDSFQVTDYGWSVYFDNCVPEFDSIVRDVILALLNEGLTDSAEIAIRLQKPQLFVDKAVGMLEAGGHIMVSKALGPSRHVGHIYGSLKRLLEE